MTGVEIGLGPCWACKSVFEFELGTVPVMPVDPVNNLPPDVRPGPDGQQVKIPRDEINPEVLERCIQALICPACAVGINQRARDNGQPPPFSDDGTTLRSVRR